MIYLKHDYMSHPICTVHSFELFLFLTVSPKLSHNILVTLHCGKSSDLSKISYFILYMIMHQKELLVNSTVVKLMELNSWCLLSHHTKYMSLLLLALFAKVLGHDFTRIIMLHVLAFYSKVFNLLQCKLSLSETEFLKSLD